MRHFGPIVDQRYKIIVKWSIIRPSCPWLGCLLMQSLLQICIRSHRNFEDKAEKSVVIKNAWNNFILIDFVTVYKYCTTRHVGIHVFCLLQDKTLLYIYVQYIELQNLTENKDHNCYSFSFTVKNQKIIIFCSFKLIKFYCDTKILYGSCVIVSSAPKCMTRHSSPTEL
jgi:hypothetical protein